MTAIVKAEIAAYTKPGFNDWGYVTRSADGSSLAVIIISIQNNKRRVSANLLVRIKDDLIIIEQDMNDKQLVDALVQAGIPREQIILAYAGEPIPEGVPDAAHFSHADRSRIEPRSCGMHNCSGQLGAKG